MRVVRGVVDVEEEEEEEEEVANVQMGEGSANMSSAYLASLAKRKKGKKGRRERKRVSLESYSNAGRMKQSSDPHQSTFPETPSHPTTPTAFNPVQAPQTLASPTAAEYDPAAHFVHAFAPESSE